MLKGTERARSRCHATGAVDQLQIAQSQMELTNTWRLEVAREKLVKLIFYVNHCRHSFIVRLNSLVIFRFERSINVHLIR